jgi:hypothetical protein
VRLSALPHDPGHVTYRERVKPHQTVIVFLDGVRQVGGTVLTADEEAGELLRVKLENGRLVRDGDEVATELVRGHVQVFIVLRGPAGVM